MPGAGPTDPAGDILSVVDPLGSHGERQIDPADRVWGHLQLLESPSDLAAALVDEADPSSATLAPTHAQNSETEPVVIDDEVARPQPADRVADRIGAVDPRFVEGRQFRDRCGQVSLAVAFSGEALFESGHTGVGLVLRERSGQQRSGGFGVESLQQVGGHVVRGPKCRPQPEALAAGEAGDLFEADERRPRNDRMPGRVESPPPGATRELGELRWCELFVGLAGELGELVDHHAASRKIHAQRKCLGGEDHPHEPFCEALLHRLLERRDETCVVARNAALESVTPCARVEHGEVGCR